MKVSEDMFGRPGKCVACRQKIRIPRLDEIPANTTELFLKDHPEFLRKVKHRPIDEQEVSPPPDDDEKPARHSAPFEVLEPLRLLANLLAQVEKQIRAMDDRGSKRAKTDDTNRAELLGHRTWIKNLQADLEEELRQRLMETAIELSSVQERIAEVSLGVRVGELEFPEYHEQMDRLRRKRDHLERRQTNIRGWLTVDDPYIAGGHQEVALSQIPQSLPRIALPAEQDTAEPLLHARVEELRTAFEQRARAERKLKEAERMKTGAAMAERSVAECVADADAERTRARARVQFCRERLEQLAEDFASDMDCLDAQLDHARGRLQAGRINREEFNDIERRCMRARGDLTKARTVAVRALSANTVDEVPRLRGTFLDRLAKPTRTVRTPAESWVAFVSAVLMLFVLFLPIAGESTPLELYRTLAAQGAEAHWLVSFPMVTAVLVALISFVPVRTIRGLALAVVWLLAGLLSAVYFHESAYEMGPVAERIREGGPLLQRTGIVVYFLSLCGVGLASAIALVPPRDTRPVFPVVALVMAVGVGAIFTDIAGMRVADPTIVVASNLVESEYPPRYETTIRVRNDGARVLVLSSDSTMANAYEFMLETKIGETSWDDAGNPERIVAAGREFKMASAGAQMMSIPAGGEAVLTYRLRAGTYRATLESKHDPAKSRQNEFTLADQAATGAPTPTDLPPGAVPGEDTQPGVSPELLRQVSPQVALRGVMATPGKAANFSILVTLPDGRSRTQTYSIGDEVHDGWIAGEFNPEVQTVTLTKEGDILILRRGETYVLAPPNGVRE
jgi:hypothetical protein